MVPPRPERYARGDPRLQDRGLVAERERPQGTRLPARHGPDADPYHFTSHLDQGAHAARAGGNFTARRSIPPLEPARIPYNP